MIDLANPFDEVGLRDIRVEEARLLKTRAPSSARMLGAVVLVAGVVLLASGLYAVAAAWLIATGAMIGLTLLYARYAQPDGIEEQNVDSYLRGHAVVTAGTGLVWGGFAIYLAATTNLYGAFVAGLFLSSLNTGGAMAGTVYRPGYLALLTCSILPFATFLIWQTDAILQIYGLFMLLYFAFCYLTNEQASRRTREAIVSTLGRDAAEQIFEQAAEIDRLNDQRARFMAAISHDMAQPMIAQRHFLTQLRSGGVTTEQDGLLERIEDVQASQERLLQDLIGFSHLSQKSLSTSPVAFEVGALLEQVAAEFDRQAHRAGQTITVAPCNIPFFADRHFLHRILRNLMSNAIKYAGPQAEIRLSAVVEATNLSVIVTDSGLGIAAADRDRAFEEYVRLSSGAVSPGLGLGLAICKRLTDAMSGQITLDGDVGKGTIVTITLPDAKPDDGTGAPAPLILVIGPPTRADIGDWSELISGWMWQFLCASDGQSAATAMAQTGLTPDILICDAGTAIDPRLAGIRSLTIGEDAGLLPPLDPEAIRQTLVRALRDGART